VTKIELGLDSGRMDACDGCAEAIIGTSATLAGTASGRAPSSKVCCGRSRFDIAHRNPAELSRFGT
jgi:hypothetical protein